jgi:hypothetical protein
MTLKFRKKVEISGKKQESENDGGAKPSLLERFKIRRIKKTDTTYVSKRL